MCRSPECARYRLTPERDACFRVRPGNGASPCWGRTVRRFSVQSVVIDDRAPSRMWEPSLITMSRCCWPVAVSYTSMPSFDGCDLHPPRCTARNPPTKASATPRAIPAPARRRYICVRGPVRRPDAEAATPISKRVAYPRPAQSFARAGQIASMRGSLSSRLKGAQTVVHHRVVPVRIPLRPRRGVALRIPGLLAVVPLHKPKSHLLVPLRRASVGT